MPVGQPTRAAGSLSFPANALVLTPWDLGSRDGPKWEDRWLSTLALIIKVIEPSRLGSTHRANRSGSWALQIDYSSTDNIRVRGLD